MGNKDNSGDNCANKKIRIFNPLQEFDIPSKARVFERQQNISIKNPVEQVGRPCELCYM